LKALEQARTAGVIGHSLDAKTNFEPRNGERSSILLELGKTDRARLQDLLIVSQVSAADAASDSASGYDSELLHCRIVVGKAEGAKCERCWKYDPNVGKDSAHPTVCPRCAGVLNAGDGA